MREVRGQGNKLRDEEKRGAEVQKWIQLNRRREPRELAADAN